MGGSEPQVAGQGGDPRRQRPHARAASIHGFTSQCRLDRRNLHTVMMFDKRIVVTGVGAVTPVGQDADASWQSLLDGRSGVAPIAGFEAEGARPSYAAEVKDFMPERAGVPRRKLKMMGRQAQLAFAAAEQAVADAGLAEDATHPDPTRFGVILGVGMLNADA